MTEEHIYWTDPGTNLVNRVRKPALRERVRGEEGEEEEEEEEEREEGVVPLVETVSSRLTDLGHLSVVQKDELERRGVCVCT